MRHAVRLLLLALGLAVIAHFVQKAGPSEVWKTFEHLGWMFPLVLLPYSIVYVFDTLGWKFAFGASLPRGLSFAELFRIRWAGEAVNNVFPSGYVGGEAVKAYLLHKRGLSVTASTTSVVVGKSLQVLAQVVYIALGALVALPLLPVGSTARTGMAAVTLLTFAAAGVLFWIQRRGMFGLILGFLERVPFTPRAWLKQRKRLEDIDAQVMKFYTTQPRFVLLSTACFFAGWLTDSLEIILVSRILGQPIDWNCALAIEAFIGVAKVLGSFVPGAIGVQESGVVMLFRLFALPAPLGVSYALIRRARELTFAVVGGTLLYFLGAFRAATGRSAPPTSVREKSRPSN